MFFNILASNPIIDSYFVSDLFGKIIFFSLFILSILTWVLFIQKFRKLRHSKKISLELATSLKNERHHPLSLEPSIASPFTKLYHVVKQHSLEILNKNRYLTKNEQAALSKADIEMLEAHLATEIASQTKLMEKNLFLLSTTVSLAPFLGLLGTVWGILITFSHLQGGGAIHGSSAVLGGLSMALGTTVCGLIVAIPALIFYNYLRSGIAHFSSEMESFSSSLLSSVELQYRMVV